MVLTWANRSLFCSVCSRNVSSTTKPRRAIFSAGFSACRRLSVPQRSRACSQVAGRAGDADARAAGHQVGGERVGLAGRRVDERVARDRLAGAVSRPSSVETLLVLRVVVDEVAAAADAGGVGLGDAEGGGGGDGGVDRVAALAQHLEAGVGRLGVDAGHRAAGAERPSRSWSSTASWRRWPGSRRRLGDVRAAGRGAAPAPVGRLATSARPQAPARRERRRRWRSRAGLSVG